ncbi:MAG: hypothetical protein KC733_02495, partial [Candidatus Omnitrophica bacterium]|nr:hypothetical protein [Candidatus Omnitrophota bacterium]
KHDSIKDKAFTILIENNIKRNTNAFAAYSQKLGLKVERTEIPYFPINVDEFYYALGYGLIDVENLKRFIQIRESVTLAVEAVNRDGIVAEIKKELGELGTIVGEVYIPSENLKQGTVIFNLQADATITNQELKRVVRKVKGANPMEIYRPKERKESLSKDKSSSPILDVNNKRVVYFYSLSDTKMYLTNNEFKSNHFSFGYGIASSSPIRGPTNNSFISALKNILGQFNWTKIAATVTFLLTTFLPLTGIIFSASAEVTLEKYSERSSETNEREISPFQAKIFNTINQIKDSEEELKQYQSGALREHKDAKRIIPSIKKHIDILQISIFTDIRNEAILFYYEKFKKENREPTRAEIYEYFGSADIVSEVTNNIFYEYRTASKYLTDLGLEADEESVLNLIYFSIFQGNVKELIVFTETNEQFLSYFVEYLDILIQEFNFWQDKFFDEIKNGNPIDETIGIIDTSGFVNFNIDYQDFNKKMVDHGWAQRVDDRRIRIVANLHQEKKKMEKVFGNLPVFFTFPTLQLAQVRYPNINTHQVIYHSEITKNLSKDFKKVMDSFYYNLIYLSQPHILRKQLESKDLQFMADLDKALRQFGYSFETLGFGLFKEGDLFKYQLKGKFKKITDDKPSSSPILQKYSLSNINNQTSFGVSLRVTVAAVIFSILSLMPAVGDASIPAEFKKSQEKITEPGDSIQFQREQYRRMVDVVLKHVTKKNQLIKYLDAIFSNAKHITENELKVLIAQTGPEINAIFLEEYQNVRDIIDRRQLNLSIRELILLTENSLEASMYSNLLAINIKDDKRIEILTMFIQGTIRQYNYWQYKIAEGYSPESIRFVDERYYENIVSAMPEDVRKEVRIFISKLQELLSLKSEKDLFIASRQEFLKQILDKISTYGYSYKLIIEKKTLGQNPEDVIYHLHLRIREHKSGSSPIEKMIKDLQVFSMLPQMELRKQLISLGAKHIPDFTRFNFAKELGILWFALVKDDYIFFIRRNHQYYNGKMRLILNVTEIAQVFPSQNTERKEGAAIPLFDFYYQAAKLGISNHDEIEIYSLQNMGVGSVLLALAIEEAYRMDIKIFYAIKPKVYKFYSNRGFRNYSVEDDQLFLDLKTPSELWDAAKIAQFKGFNFIDLRDDARKITDQIHSSRFSSSPIEDKLNIGITIRDTRLRRIGKITAITERRSVDAPEKVAVVRFGGRIEIIAFTDFNGRYRIETDEENTEERKTTKIVEKSANEIKETLQMRKENRIILKIITAERFIGNPKDNHLYQFINYKKGKYITHQESREFLYQKIEEFKKSKSLLETYFQKLEKRFRQKKIKYLDTSIDYIFTDKEIQTLRRQLQDKSKNNVNGYYSLIASAQAQRIHINKQVLRDLINEKVTPLVHWEIMALKLLIEEIKLTSEDESVSSSISTNKPSFYKFRAITLRSYRIEVEEYLQEIHGIYLRLTEEINRVAKESNLSIEKSINDPEYYLHDVIQIILENIWQHEYLFEEGQHPYLRIYSSDYPNQGVRIEFWGPNKLKNKLPDLLTVREWYSESNPPWESIAAPKDARSRISKAHGGQGVSFIFYLLGKIDSWEPILVGWENDINSEGPQPGGHIVKVHIPIKRKTNPTFEVESVSSSPLNENGKLSFRKKAVDFILGVNSPWSFVAVTAAAFFSIGLSFYYDVDVLAYIIMLTVILLSTLNFATK